MILQRYVLRELALHFVFVAAAVTGVLLLAAFIQIARTFEGVSLELLVQAMPIFLGFMAPWALQVAAAASTTLVYGRLAADHEIDAMRLAGIPPWRILLPALVFGAVLSGGSWLLAEHTTPYVRQLRRESIRQSVLQILRDPPPGPQMFTIGAYRLSYHDFRAGRMERPALLHFQGERLAFEYYAPEGRVHVQEGGRTTVVLSRPRYVQMEPGGTEHRFRAESDVPVTLELDLLTRSTPWLGDWPGELIRERIRTSRDPQELHLLRVYLHARWAEAAAPPLLVLVCMGAGIAVRRGSRLAGLGAALPPLLLHIALTMFFHGLGMKERVDPRVAEWTANALMGLLAAGFLATLWRRG